MSNHRKPIADTYKCNSDINFKPQICGELVLSMLIAKKTMFPFGLCNPSINSFEFIH